MRIGARRLCKAGAGGTRMTDEHVSSDPYHIQAAPAAAAIQKLVLKHQESFIVADRAGDFPTHFEGELGFSHEGTRAAAYASRTAGSTTSCASPTSASIRRR